MSDEIIHSEQEDIELPAEESLPEQDEATTEPALTNEGAPETSPEAETEISAEVPSEAPAEEAAPAPSPKTKEYKTRSKITAFIFFAITLAVFVAYETFCVKFLYLPFANAPGSLSEAIGAIFGYVFGLIITFIFGIVQLPENIISIILFKRLRGKSDKPWENTLFTVFFALSLVMLLATILSFALFLVVSLLG